MQFSDDFASSRHQFDSRVAAHDFVAVNLGLNFAPHPKVVLDELLVGDFLAKELSEHFRILGTEIFVDILP